MLDPLVLKPRLLAGPIGTKASGKEIEVMEMWTLAVAWSSGPLGKGQRGPHGGGIHQANSMGLPGTLLGLRDGPFHFCNP